MVDENPKVMQRMQENIVQNHDERFCKYGERFKTFNTWNKEPRKVGNDASHRHRGERNYALRRHRGERCPAPAPRGTTPHAGTTPRAGTLGNDAPCRHRFERLHVCTVVIDYPCWYHGGRCPMLACQKQGKAVMASLT